jgi:hypothetical protein
VVRGALQYLAMMLKSMDNIDLIPLAATWSIDLAIHLPPR